MEKVKGKHATLQEHQRALLVLLQEFDRICKVLDIPYMLFAGTMLGAVRHKGFIPWDDDLDIIMLRKDYDVFLENANTYLNKGKFFLQKEFSEHWPMFFSKLRLNNTTCLEKYHPKDNMTHQGIYIDIFPCDNAAKSLIGRKIQFYASKFVIAKSLNLRGYDTDSIKKKIFIACANILPTEICLKLVKGQAETSGYVHSFFGGASRLEKNVYPEKWFEEYIEMEFENAIFPVSVYYDEMLKQLYGDYKELPPLEERKVKQHAILVDLTQSYEVYKHYRDDMHFDVYSRSIR